MANTAEPRAFIAFSMYDPATGYEVSGTCSDLAEVRRLLIKTDEHMNMFAVNTSRVFLGTTR